MTMSIGPFLSVVATWTLALIAPPAMAAPKCPGLPTHEALRSALAAVRAEDNGGLNLDMWGALVDRDGVLCAVAYSGADRSAQWPGSRTIAAQKAYTANAFSLPKLALSTANLYAAVQPGGSLYGLQHSNPVDTAAAYGGDGTRFGTDRDPLVGRRMGGINVFGGGVALYDAKGTLVGGLGVSGDTSCADHNIAWKTRQRLGLDKVPAGVSPVGDDNIVYLGAGEVPNGFKHPRCGGKEAEVKLPAVPGKG